MFTNTYNLYGQLTQFVFLYHQYCPQKPFYNIHSLLEVMTTDVKALNIKQPPKLYVDCFADIENILA